jgi:hypothetical protein
MIAQSNVTQMLVGKDLDILASTATREDLTVGQIGVFLVGSTTAKTTALSAGDRYSIAFKNAKGVVIETPVITFGSETNKVAKLYEAPVQQSSAIGYNGTSGSIEVSNSTNYVAHVFWKDNSKTFGGQGQPVKFAAYYSDAASTQLEIATGLTENFNKNFSRENPKVIKAETLSAAAGAAMTGTGTLTVVNGSKYATAGTDVDAVLTVGDYVRIGGTATTDPVYKVIALDTTNEIVTLNTPYQGASATVAEAATEVVTAAAGAAAAAGVKLTALPVTDEFQAGVVRYDVTTFDVELKEEFGATTYSELTTPSTGSGTYWEVAQNEWFLKGNRGETWRVGRYPKENILEATSGKTYDHITVEYAQDNSKTIDRNVKAFGAYLIATEDASVGAIHASLKTVLGIS